MRRYPLVGRLLVTFTLLAAMLPIGAAPAAGVPGGASTVFINEIHYDNTGADVGEFVEVAGPAGTDLGGWSLVFYNGNGGAPYATVDMSGVLTDQSGGYGTAAFDRAGIQNGSPDGVALVNGSTLVQFLSYEGTFAAVDGPASGQISTDIRVSEPSTTLIGESLQLTGTGLLAGEFFWTGPTLESPGSPNPGQSFGTPPAPAVVINEIDYDQPGTDTAEFIELKNTGSVVVDLTGWSLDFVNGNGGSLYNNSPVALPTASLAPGDYFVICANPTTTPDCDFDVSPDTNLIQNGAPDAVGLRDAGGSLADTVSYEGDTVAPYTEGSGVGLEDTAGPGDGNKSISRVPDGADTDQNDVDFALVCGTPGASNVDTTTDCVPEPSPCAAGAVPISAIQGSGDVTPCDGETVTIEGVVVGDYEGPSPALRGFYVQEQDPDQDGDPLTSEGIFVFHGNEDTVALGDLVEVTGVVGEFQGQTQIGFPATLKVVSSANAVTPATITLPLASADSLEAVEGMLVEAPQTLFVTEFFQLGRFGQVVVSSGDRLDQPTAVAEPGSAANAVQAANDLNRLIIDDDLNNQNPDPILFGRGGNELTASNTLRGGDTVTGAVGVLTYTWAGNSASGNAYRLRPVGDLSDSGLVSGGVVPNFSAANPRPSSAPVVGGSLHVASFNVLNYFSTIDTGPDICGPGQNEDCRGADSAEELTRQQDKLMSALIQLDADVVGLMELENTPGVDPEGDIASQLNTRVGSGAYAAVDAAGVGGGIVGLDAIRVGMIYQPGSVTPLGDPALLDFALDPLGEDRSRTAVAQSFVENGTGEAFTVVVNHFKSKSGSEIDDSGGKCALDPGYADCDQGDGQGFFNATRTAHAAQLRDWLATDPTGSGDADVLIVGDLNSYAMEDPIDVLANAGYVDLLAGPDSYSFVFDGQWGYLDYVLASSSLAGGVTGTAEYHINADEPPVLDYNTAFKSANQIEILYAPDEFRTSDHDPAIVGLAMGSGFTAAASPEELWPPNHKHVGVAVSGSDGAGGALTAEILDVTSSEADSGLSEGDEPDDIVVTTPTTVDLRAERYSQDGRIYTIYLRLTDGNQVVFTTTEVVVPHDRGN
ncbi:MAG: ExeM/NucH family extracellular endonuclease [Acidimicrobiia bacterium]|nr:ExeM/NucH family extracellular endonuclease [Acidimicrobiia bacterium]